MRVWIIFLGVSITLLYCTQIYSLIEYKRTAKGGVDQFASEVESISDRLQDNSFVSKMDESELKETFTNAIDTMLIKTTVYSILGLLGGLMLFFRYNRFVYISAIFLSSLFVLKSIEYIESHQTFLKTILIILKNKPFLAMRNDILPMLLSAMVFSIIVLDIVRNFRSISKDRV